MMTNISENQLKFIAKINREKKLVRIGRIGILIAFIIIWEITARFEFIDSFIFASPSIIANSMYDLCKEGTLFYHIGITLIETIVSFFMVFLVGIVITIVLWISKKSSEILEPYLVVLNSLPKSALAPLLIVWLGGNMKTIIVAGMSVAIFGTILTLYTGFREVDQDSIKLIYTLGGKKKDVLRLVILPSNIPLIISTMKVNIGLCLVGVIIGEFLAAKRGLGYLIIYGSQVFKLDLVITSIIILCILATIFYKGINYIEIRYLSKL